MKQTESKVEELLQARAEIEEQLRRHKTLITVLFTDVVGSTSYYDRFGDTAGLVMVHRHSELGSEAIRRHDGTVIKTIGDSIMAQFSDPKSAVSAAVEMQQHVHDLNSSLPETRRVKLRIGIHTGMGFTKGADVYGDVVNLAARITKRTAAEQILISRAVHEAITAETGVTCRRIGKCTIDGRTEKEEIFEVVWLGAVQGVSITRPTVAPGLLHPTEPSTPHVSSVFPVESALPAIFPQRYELLEMVGAGGVGIVYKARDLETNELLALKVLKPEAASDPVAQANFKNELCLARKITHKNVCRIYDLNRNEGLVYASMEYVEGENLLDRLQRSGRFSPNDALKIMRQICAGLREAHAQGVVHRDLKPANVMVDQKGTVKIMDFGIARLMESGAGYTGTIVGTPAYMSPEQAEGTSVDARTDIYALGLILYEMVTGTPTFCGDTPIAVALKHVREIPRPPHELVPALDPHIERAILKCLEKNPADRFQSVGELEATLHIKTKARPEAKKEAKKEPNREVAVQASVDVKAKAEPEVLRQADESAAAFPLIPIASATAAPKPAVLTPRILAAQLASTSVKFVAQLKRSTGASVVNRMEIWMDEVIAKSPLQGRIRAQRIFPAVCGIVLLGAFSLAFVTVHHRMTSVAEARMVDSSASRAIAGDLIGARAPSSGSPESTSAPSLSTTENSPIPVRASLSLEPDASPAGNESVEPPVRSEASQDKLVPRTAKNRTKPQQLKSRTPVPESTTLTAAAANLSPAATAALDSKSDAKSTPLSAAAAPLVEAPSHASDVAGQAAGNTASAEGQDGDVPAGKYFDMGSFKDLSWAAHASDSLEALGFHVTISHKGHLWANAYHVLVGPYADDTAAGTARASLEEHGFKPRPSK